MHAIILAAGRGSRLHPYTADCPKCLTQLGGITLIERQLDSLRENGIHDITIVTGYLSEQLQLPGTSQITNAAWDRTNMVESLFAAEGVFGDDLIVSYSDIVYEPRVLGELISSTSDVSVIVDKSWKTYWEFRFYDPLNDAESLKMTDTNLITDIGNKVKSINEIEAQYIGLMRFKGKGIQSLIGARQSMRQEPRAWKEIRPVEKAYMTDLLMEMILMGIDVSAVPVEAGWLEIDTIDDFKKTQALFDNGSINRFYTPSSKYLNSK